VINADMRLYNYFTLGEYDDYGQPTTSNNPVGQIKMAIYNLSTTIGDNVKYKDAQYIGLTNAEVRDTYIIEFEESRLKVLYVIPKGRYKQVFLSE
jgi:hypothetical protein